MSSVVIGKPIITEIDSGIFIKRALKTEKRHQKVFVDIQMTTSMAGTGSEPN